MTETDGSVENRRHYRYYDLILGGFITVLLCSNLIGPAKSCMVAGIKFGAGNIFFPISYIFGDVLAEVYGYARARKVIWAGFFALIFATVMAQVIIHLPTNPDEPLNVSYQPAVELLFGGTWRIVAGSMVAFWVGDFANSYVLTKMKILTQGRHLWSRTIGSTIIGQALDSLIFYPIAFYGIWQNSELIKILAFNWLFKISIEVIFTPITYAVVGFLKREEQEDYYDHKTNFSPFSLRD
ncbi:MAG TPA: queuosine precursor transporter [Pseudomonadota bacterium]|nr:queuosine precursor transporter [Pseudomonadota bacterium]HND09838.1 queuosine precursor transporter [Pseudomonadota bacterium]HNF97260.1 queuosine precursor transporter [Pseudomonadota bacterium]HNI59867.1 queuosine precursor transporter [Pseudomonadota bacterium]HNK45997.1 queuosine precursor transporter [Pseudomonadota bacterium]